MRVGRTIVILVVVLSFVILAIFIPLCVLTQGKTLPYATDDSRASSSSNADNHQVADCSHIHEIVVHSYLGGGKQRSVYEVLLPFHTPHRIVAKRCKTPHCEQTQMNGNEARFFRLLNEQYGADSVQFHGFYDFANVHRTFR